MPVIPWSPADRRELLAAVVRDPAALVVSLPPLSGDPARDRAALSAPASARCGGAPPGCRSGCRRPRWRGRPSRPAAAGPDIALWMVPAGAAAGLASRLPRRLPRAGSPSGRPGAPLPPPDLVLPWGGDPGPATRDRRRRELAAALAACRFREAAWFPALAAALPTPTTRRGDRPGAPAPTRPPPPPEPVR